MTLPQAIKSCFSKYCTFQGRASRSEYWWFYFFRLAFGMIMIMLCGFLYGMAGGPGVGGRCLFYVRTAPGGVRGGICDACAVCIGAASA
ncbi:MAG: DUF805 domain-containing protein [Succinivibrio sp.]|nr:DUF805 domain-containing protein [Succinivibrio sp.]